MEKTKKFFYSNGVERAKDYMRAAAAGVTAPAMGLRKFADTVDLSNVTNSWHIAKEEKLGAMSEIMATETQAVGQVVDRVGRVIGDDLSKVGSGISEFIKSKKTLALVAEGVKDLSSATATGISKAAEFTAEKVKVGAKKTAKGLANKLYNSDWEEESEYEPPKIIGLPPPQEYFLSVDEKQQSEGDFHMFFFISVCALLFTINNKIKLKVW